MASDWCAVANQATDDEGPEKERASLLPRAANHAPRSHRGLVRAIIARQVPVRVAAVCESSNNNINDNNRFHPTPQIDQRASGSCGKLEMLIGFYWSNRWLSQPPIRVGVGLRRNFGKTRPRVVEKRHGRGSRWTNRVDHDWCEFRVESKGKFSVESR